MKAKLVSICGFVACILMAASYPASATFATHSFSATLADYFSGYGFPGDFAVGNPFTINAGYDDTATDINSDPDIGLYLLGAGSILSASVAEPIWWFPR